jgi:hypothetical protein
MSGGHARLLVLYNPRAARGYLYQQGKAKQANVVKVSAFTHPNVVLGKDVIPGAVTRQATARRINTWTRPLIQGEKITADVFKVPDYLVGFRAEKLTKKEDGSVDLFPAIKAGFRKIIEPSFAYMVLGRYPTQTENQLISREACELALARGRAYFEKHLGLSPTSQPKMGLDVAELGKDLNVETLRYENGYIPPQKEWGGLNIDDTAIIAAEDYKTFNCVGAYIDSNGLGAGVWPKMEKLGCEAHRIMVQESATENAYINGEPFGEFYRLRDQGWWMLREWLHNDPNSMLPPGSEIDKGLIDQLCSATYHKMPNSGKIKICDNEVMKSQLGGSSPDHATSLMLTFCPESNDGDAEELVSCSYIKN